VTDSGEQGESSLAKQEEKKIPRQFSDFQGLENAAEQQGLFLPTHSGSALRSQKEGFGDWIALQDAAHLLQFISHFLQLTALGGQVGEGAHITDSRGSAQSFSFS
jgi:hypothetical protein